ncbi:MAG: DUF1579 domain-containing protein [Taibaiella sp.]|nr:DUF1579 domain-containing protein [Taibaiella sp.]
MKQGILVLFPVILLMACNTNEKVEGKNKKPLAFEVVNRPSDNNGSKEQNGTMNADGRLNNTPVDPGLAAVYAMPAEQHRQLAASAGLWRTEMVYWTGPGAKPAKVLGTCDIKMVLGGRYQQSIYKSESNGVPFEGIGYIAYDNARRMYISTWMDNTGTGVVYLEGGYDKADATTEMVGQCTEVASCRQRGMRQVTTNIDENTQLLEMYQTPEGGDEYKSMQVKFTRVNKSGQSRGNDLAALH